jgi:hypothetical protein
MKRTFLSVALLSATVLAVGQRTWHHGQHIETPLNNDRGEDTVVTSAIADGPLTVYASGSGFVIGNNNYGDKAKAQVFDLGGEVVVDELLFLFGGKVATSGNPDSKIVANVWTLDGTGTGSGGDIPCPGTSVASADVGIDAVDTTGAFTGALLGPVNLTGAFAVGFDVSTLAEGDSVGLVSTEFDNASSTDGSWELWEDDTWHTFSDPAGWGGALDLFVAVVFTAIVGVEEEASVNGIHMTIQNGTVIDQNVDLAFTLPASAKTGVLVYDATGRQIAAQQLGSRAAGKNLVSIDASSWSAGQYYITLVANGTAMAQKVVKR